MFSRNEKLLLAGIMFCVFVTGAMIPVGMNWLFLGANQSETRYTEHYNRACEAQNTIGFTAIGNAFIKPAPGDVKSDIHKPETGNPSYDPDNCDLAAQYLAARSAQASSYWAGLSFAATMVGLLFLWRTLLYTGGALTAANKTLDQAMAANAEARRAADAAETQTRAHLLVEEAFITDHAAILNGKHCILPYAMVKITNCGKTPARNVFMVCQFVTAESGNFEICVPFRTIGPDGDSEEKAFFWSDLRVKSERADDGIARYGPIRKWIDGLSMYGLEIRVSFNDLFGDVYSVTGTYTPKGGKTSFGRLVCGNEHEAKNQTYPVNPSPRCKIDPGAGTPVFDDTL